MSSLKYTVIAVVIASLHSVLASHTTQAEDYSGAQFLVFNGTISATVNYSSPATTTCKSSTEGPFVNAYIYVGTNPPWDSNPFFFELYHLSTEGGSFISFTDDTVYNLDFTSSAYACWSSQGEPCSSFVTLDPDWRPEVVLDLTKASVKKVKVGEEDGYEVSGDEKTYLKNETERATVNGVDVASGCIENGVDGVQWGDWVWTEATSWTYTVTFSNSTAKATVKTTWRGSTMELTIAGDRITNPTAWPNIELVTDDESKPKFRYSNDSDIHFKNFSSGWRASPEAYSESMSSSTLPTPTTKGGASATEASTGTPKSTGAAENVHVTVTVWPFLFVLGMLFVFN